ncbi:MAG: thioesterase II family protein [Ktedonobacteraceae bacterium]
MLLSPDGWIYFPKPKKQAPLRLFCFPGGGASATMFFPWIEWLPDSIEVAAVQLPGRTPELPEPTGTNLALIVQEIADAIRQYQDRPFAFFGHSLGGVLAFEVARYLSLHFALEPMHLFFACCPPLHLPRTLLPLLNVPEQELLPLLLSTFADSLPMLQRRSSQQHFLTLTHLDLIFWKDYHFTPGKAFTCPLTILSGAQDTLFHAELLSGWTVHTTGPCSFQTFPGNHCFFYSNPVPLLQTLVQCMGQEIRQEVVS